MAELGKPLKINLNCHKNIWLGGGMSYTPVKSTRVTGDSMHLTLRDLT